MARHSAANPLNRTARHRPATERQPIEAGRKEDKPTDWAAVEKIAGLAWPEAETKPLEEVRKAALAKYPELSPKVEDSKE